MGRGEPAEECEYSNLIKCSPAAAAATGRLVIPFLLVLLPGLRGAASAPAQQRSASTTRQDHKGAQKQGSRAWEHFAGCEHEGEVLGRANRLFAHAVQDTSMLQKYLPKVRAFLRWALQRGATFATNQEIDLYLADYLMVLCYGEEKEHWYGSELFHGFRAISPREGSGPPWRTGRSKVGSASASSARAAPSRRRP